MPTTGQPQPEEIVSVPISRWVIAAPPMSLRTLLGSCVGVVLYDRTAKIGGLAHILLPDSRGNTDQIGKYADTAIPALLTALEGALKGKPRSKLIAKIAGGAAMFPSTVAINIGEQNVKAVERILAGLDIHVAARHLGGQSGRRMTLNTTTGLVEIRIPGGGDFPL